MECWRKVCWPSLTNLGKLRLFVNLNFHVLFWVVFSHHLSSIYWNSLHVLIDWDYTSPTCVNLVDSSSPFQSSLVKLQSCTNAPIVSIYRDFIFPYLWHFTEILQLPNSVNLPNGMMPRFGQFIEIFWCSHFVNCQIFYNKNKITWKNLYKC